jgi:general secretion pathway protein F
MTMADATGGGSGVGRVTIDQLIALNDEVVALTRAGVPLERGLIDVGSDLPGRLGSIARALGERMGRGESLSEALAAGTGVPPVYRAVVEAGLRSGRLPVALEGMAAYARSYAEARRSIGLALSYPLLVACLAYVLFLFIAARVIPRFVTAFASLGVPAGWSVRLLGGLADSVWIWGPVVPVAMAGLLGVWVGTRGAFGRRGGASALLRAFPWMGSMMRGFEASGFAEVLALLVEHGVPYPEALRLAGEASGEPGLARSARALADAVARGVPPAEALRGPSDFPPLLHWLLATATHQADFPATLRQMAARYRSLARFQADKLRVLLPMILLCAIGGTATLLYTLALFVPLTSLWNGLTGQAP